MSSRSSTPADASWHQDPYRLAGVLIVAAAVAVVLLVAGWKRFSIQREAVARTQDLSAGPRVQVASATLSGSDRTVNLTAEARPYETVTLYAKTSGYLSSVLADKGDSVSKGQVLAVIESPETDHDFDSAKADAENKQHIADRYKPLLEKKLVSQQEAEQAYSDAAMAQANLERISSLKGYEQIRAPFDGTVTARYVDQNALVQSAVSAETGAQPLFTVSRTNRLRVTFYLDQRDAPFIKVGSPVEITAPEHPETPVHASVTRVAGELDPNTRTMLAEAEVDDRSGRLVPGGFVQVSLRASAPAQLQIPVEALLTRQGGAAVAVIGADGVVHYRAVQLGDDDGQRVRVLAGLAAGDKVALNLGNSVQDGDHVRPIDPSQAQAQK